MSRDGENPLDKYMRRHERAYSFSTPDHWPSTRLRVEFHRGYVRLSHPRQGEFYITRNAWGKVLYRSLKVWKYMDRQFSVPKATRKYLAAEKLHDQALRAQKKARQRRAQKKRFRAAQRRAARRRNAESD